MTIKPLRNEPLVDRIFYFVGTVIILTSLTYFGAHFLAYLLEGPTP